MTSGATKCVLCGDDLWTWSESNGLCALCRDDEEEPADLEDRLDDASDGELVECPLCGLTREHVHYDL